MKTINNLKTLFLKVIRDKNNYFFIIILIISTIFLISSLIFKDNFNSYIEENINKNISFRTLLVSTKPDKEDFGESELLEIDHVVDVYSSSYNMIYVESDLANKKVNGQIELVYLPKSTIIHSLIGSQFNENDKNIVIIPKEFYPDSKANDYNISKDYIIDGESLLGKEIEIKYYTYIFDNMEFVIDETLTKKLLVVGVYDNKEMMNYNNQVFISKKDMDEIAKSKIPNNDNSEVQISQNYSYNVVVDDLDNVQVVMNQIKNKGFQNVEISIEIDQKMVNIIEISCYSIFIISTLIIIFIIILYIKKKLIREANFIGILRASGYSKKDIIKQYTSETILTAFITYIIGILLFTVVFLILKNTAFGIFSYLGFNIKLSFADLLISFIIIILITLINTIYFLNEKLKNNIINLIESRE